MAQPVTIGKYQIGQLLGKGGMSAVYQALDPAIQRQVALKIVEKSMLDGAERRIVLDRFKYEAQASGRLIHPGIVTIYEYGEDDDTAYIAMELVRGDSVHEYLQQSHECDFRRIGEIILPLLDALQYSHEQGVTHRDIKPSNILIGEDGRIKVTDFGIARIEANALTQFGLAVGTPYYMSPEQCMGDDTDARTDIYSVGVIAYELLTGRRPFPGKGSNASIMRDVLDTLPPAPSEINPKITGQMDWVIQKALAKKLDERYQSAAEFSADFKLAIDDCIAGSTAAAPAIAPVGPDSLRTAQERPPSLRLSPAVFSAARKISFERPATLPGAPAESVPAATTTQPVSTSPVAVESKRFRILFVDDEERILSALKSIFRAKYHVFTATNGQQAIEFLKRFRVHLIVSDQRMPNMTGVEMLRQAKEMSPNTVRILLTGYSDLASIVGSINDGEVYRFINKPWNNQDIQGVIAEACAIGDELFDMTLPQTQSLGKMDEAILVVDETKTLLCVTQELFGETYTVLHAENIVAALNVMQQREVAVIVADIGAGDADGTAPFKLLKREHPEILTIVVTEASDSELVIELINQAQVFRFVNKPVNVKLLSAHIQAALARFQQFKAAPKLLHTHKVSISDKLLSSRLGKALVDKIRLLGRFLPGSK